MKEEKGYEVLDMKKECEDQYKEKMKRDNRVMGYGDSEYYGSESGHTVGGGFLHRNNVMDKD